MVPEKVTQGRFPQGAGMGGAGQAPHREDRGLGGEWRENSTHTLKLGSKGESFKEGGSKGENLRQGTKAPECRGPACKSLSSPCALQFEGFGYGP